VRVTRNRHILRRFIGVLSGSGGQCQRAVVVAVVTVREVQVAIDQIIHMVTVRHHFMPAAGTVDMAGIVTGTVVLRGTGDGIGCADGNHMLVNVPVMREVQMTIVQIINMPLMTYGCMPTVGTMLVGMIGVLEMGAGGHGMFLWSVGWKDVR